MLFKKNYFLASVFLCLGILVLYACISKKTQTTSQATPADTVARFSGVQPRLLVFRKTAGFYHQSIPSGVAAIQKLAEANRFRVDTTVDSKYFNDDSLKNYAAVIFLSTTGNVLNMDQQAAFERYIQAGGGFLGVHAAADTEYDWPWYNKLVGAYFLSHPRIQQAAFVVNDRNHPSTNFLPERWTRTDELYNYKSIQPDLKVLISLDETTYQGGANGANHPIAWYHDFDGGRAFYTGLGHTNESFADSLYLRHLMAGITYAIGNNKLDYSKAYAVRSPEDNRFTKTVLSEDLNEPMELTVAPDGRVFFTERAGNLYVYEPQQKKTRLIRQFPTKAVDKYLNGLIGITLDPDFEKNNYIYFFYSSQTGDNYHQNISRFVINKNSDLDTTSEKIIIKVPIDLEVSAHTGGSLAWDTNGNLFISTGDNTVPFESSGYAPMDERAGRHIYDAQRSAGNPNDLRGKILRIHVEPDGTYTIPAGNLFPKGTEGTKPEIYVMGCRNPYRITVDQATNILYWGEVGPDAGTDATHGPRGYDEFNQARKAGYYGWPYFVGDNKAYNDSDFATKAIGPLFDAMGPKNMSPNNKGIQQLPPATKAMIWYPYARSAEFPDLGEGGRCAMGGPVYHYTAGGSPGKLPAYYDKAYFIYDWMRNWVFAVRFDENYNYKRMEKFMGSNGDFRRPVDMEFGADGTLYMLEYGSVYGIDNVDARLVRIDYNAGNRAPVASIATKDTIGLSPMTVNFSGAKSYDFDEEDKLSYEWYFTGNQVGSTAANPKFTFTENGEYPVVLKVKDKSGLASTDTMLIRVGNTLPVVKISTTNNSTFFFNKATPLTYNVAITDNEDKTIDQKQVNIAMRFIAKVADNEPLVGHQQLPDNYNLGKNLIALSDCKACHQLAGKSVGPSFTEVSKKYRNDKNAPGYLANKVITGGNGVWGEHAMSAHPQLSKEDATEMVKYVLSVTDVREDVRYPQKGIIALNEHTANPDDGRYIISAAYTDKGGAISPLTTREVLVLRPAKVAAADADIVFGAAKQGRRIGSLNNKSFFAMKNIDLTDVDSLTINLSSRDMAGRIEVHIDSAKGQMISTLQYQSTGGWNRYVDHKMAITNPGGRHDLYFVVLKDDEPNKNLATISWVRFEGGKSLPVNFKPAKKVAAAEPVKRPQTADETASIKPTAKAPGKPAPFNKAMFSKSDCLACHSPTEKIVGPAFVEIAKKYKGKSNATSMLADKIIKGGSGVWGAIPMAPHPQISKADATKMVTYILSLK
jgi:cytochrome c